MGDLWENFTSSLDTIKNVVFGFIDIVNLIFSLIPEPFNLILKVAVVIIFALIVLKIVRG